MGLPKTQSPEVSTPCQAGRWHALLLAAILAGAGILRAWGLWSGELIWHPDEIFMVIYPLNLFSGDLNPHVFSYPSFHLYELALLYGVDFLWQSLVNDVGRFDWIAGRYFADATPLRDMARWLSVGYAVGTVALAGVLGGRLTAAGRILSAPGLLAAALMAVNVVHVRQSPLAAVDTPMAFWFAAAAVASVRLLTMDRCRDYLLAGVFVGVAGATKYPGVACCLGVVAAHALSGRRFFDVRLWLAGACALATFVALSPYVLLDFGSFSDQFLFQLAHAEAGRFGIDPGPLFHLRNGLRLGVGLAAWLVWLGTSVWAIRHRQTAHLVVLATTLGGYVAISWGDLVFLRYVLPLLPLQAAVVAAGACQVAAALGSRMAPVRRWLAMPVVVCLLLAQPLLASFQVAEFAARRDTRTLARDWFHEHVPAGSSYCNFGGWPGDVQVRTYEDQWWRLNGFLAYWPQDAHARLAKALEAVDGQTPFFSEAVRNSNRAQEQGSVELIHEHQCAYVVTHEHALPYSTIDTSFAQRLTREARRVARFDPGGDDEDVFDTMDGYYVPVSGFGAERPGPLVEIWEVPAYRTLPRPTTQRHVLSRALSQMAANAVNDADWSSAVEALKAATALDPDNEHALLVAARMHWDVGDTVQARQRLDDMLQRDSTSTRAMAGMAQLAADRGDRAGAIRWLEQVNRRRPRDVKAAGQLAELYWQVGEHQRALTLKARNVDLRPWLAQGHYDLGSGLLQAGDFEQALPHLLRAIAIAPDTGAYYPRAAAVHDALGQHEQADELRHRASQLAASVR